MAIGISSPRATWASIERSTALRRAVLIVMPLLFACFILASAWVAEDAYITFRVLDNAVHGYGLRWNVDERVQVFTHPLWLLLQWPIYAITHEEYYSCIALSFVCAMAACLLLCHRWRHAPYLLAGVVFLPMLCATGLVDYAISGLENPLSALLTVLFFLLFLNGERSEFRLAWVASLLLLTRFDHCWLLLPAGAVLLFRHGCRAVWWRGTLLGLLPLAAWCLFSLFYYGFVFPNTKYAKLNTGIAERDLLRQSAHYFADFFLYQTPAAFAILLSLALAVLYWRRWSIAMKTSAAGLALYLCYIAAVGGDFMAGRFFTTPLMLAVILLAEHATILSPRAIRRYVAGVAVAVLALSMVNAFFPRPEVVSAYGIADERIFYSTHNMLVHNLPTKAALMAAPWVRDGLELRAAASNPATPRTVMRGNIGMSAFFAGPGFTYLDPYGLSDVLLARLPLADRHAWRIGHFFRVLPQGYLTYRTTGDAAAMDPDLLAYTAALDEIARAPLWSAHRLRTILRFHAGAFDAARAHYVAQTVARTDWPLQRIAEKRALPPLPNHNVTNADARNLVIAEGVTYRFTTSPISPREMSFAMLNHCDFRFDFLRRGQPLAHLETPPLPLSVDAYDVAHTTVAVPPAVRLLGFDELRIRSRATGRGFAATCHGLPPTLYYAQFD